MKVIRIYGSMLEGKTRTTIGLDSFKKQANSDLNILNQSIGYLMNA